jgi:hypothetical protein
VNRRNVGRLFFWLFFGLAALLAISAMWFALFPRPEQFGPERVSALAAALAVIAALLAAWTSQASREFIEDRELPDLRLFPDPYSRYQLFLLALENSGSTSAYDVQVRWRGKPLQNHKGEEIIFNVSALRPQSRRSKTLGLTHSVLQKYGSETFEGAIEYYQSRDAISESRERFMIDFSEYGGVLLYDREALKTHHSLQLLPDKLDRLNGNIEWIRKALEQRQVETGAKAIPRGKRETRR